MLSLSAPFRLGLWAAGGGSTVDAQEAALSALGATIYNIGDLTSLFVGRDGSGGNVAVDGLPGLILDKGQFGGMTAAAFIASQPDLIGGAGSFDSAIGWTGTTWRIGGGVFSVPSENYDSIYRSADISPGKTYIIEFDISITDSGGTFVYFGPANVALADGGPFVGHRRFIVKAPDDATGTLQIYTLNAGTGPIIVDNFTLKELPGRHRVAASDSARATLRVSGAGKHYLDFSGLDDQYLVAYAEDFPQPFTVVQGVGNYLSSPGVNRYRQAHPYAVGFRAGAGTYAYAGNTVGGPVLTDDPTVIADVYNGVTSYIRVDGVPGTTSDSGTEPLATAGNSLKWPPDTTASYHDYGAVILASADPDAVALAEAWVAARTGVTLP